MLSIWNPLLPVSGTKSDNRISVRDYFDRVFEDTFRNAFADFHIPSNIGIGYEKLEDGSLAVSLDVPGVAESDISVEVNDGIVSVKAERKDKKSTYTISKSFSIPEEYDAESIQAQLANGVLTLTMPAKPIPEKISKKIEIKVLKP